MLCCTLLDEFFFKEKRGKFASPVDHRFSESSSNRHSCTCTGTIKFNSIARFNCFQRFFRGLVSPAARRIRQRPLVNGVESSFFDETNCFLSHRKLLHRPLLHLCLDPMLSMLSSNGPHITLQTF